MITNFYNFIIEEIKYWTDERLQDEANKYKSRSEFQKNNSSAYSIAHRRKLLDELFKNHINNGFLVNRNGYWTEKRLQDEANKYKTRGEFQKNSHAAYSIAYSKKLLDELFKNHINNGYTNKQVISGYWTKERLQDEVNKYETRSELKKTNSSVYSIAQRNNILDDLFKNHSNNGFADKEEWKENSYVIYVYELVEFNKAYIGLTNNIIRRDREHLFNEKERLINFCKENNISLPKYKILEEDLNSNEAQKRENYWLNFYKNNGWLSFNIAKTGSLGSAIRKWTKKKLQEEADKYETRGEFKKNNQNAYSAARTKKLLDELFKNHINQGFTEEKVKLGYWSEERLQDEANKYETRTEFAKNNPVAYNAALDKKLLDKIFKNHPNQGYSENKYRHGYWTEERLQDEANKYKTRREFSLNNKIAYGSAVKKGLLDKIFQNHPNQGYKK